MSSTKKTLVVFGGTGLQGGSVARYFLQLPNSPYRVRVVTRDPSSEKAQAIASQGAELVRGHLDDADSLASAVKGAHAVFLVTDFFTNVENPENEAAQGKRAVDAIAQSPTLEHFIWSCLPSAIEATKGKYDAIIHFDGKATVTDYIEKQHKDLWAKTTVLWVGPYMQLWLQMPQMFAPQKVVENGKETYVSLSNAGPEAVYPSVDVSRETGKTVHAILKKGRELAGKTVTLVGDLEQTRKQMLEIWGKIVGKDVEVRQRTDEETMQYLASLNFPEYLQRDITQVGPAFQEFPGLFLGKNAILASEILSEDEKLATWEDYVKSANWEPLLSL
ncbi:NAD(P)-binding protein [Lophiostoma macrostomum CBS 122681]|uniref:NAD(P)-binding protein n=1 Tax=Lophiostoma macrostomum CBS 122681 TaxID=1314788 RepID=A0A6A6SZM1_9PLEO|nr:NAD(P)-binding protein [Lophiostoma macrostomum CBS 122681]